MNTNGICQDESSAGLKTNTVNFVTEWLYQTREQHIKREKATSNICTAQALLATMAGFYAVYHGQEGITTIASRIHSITVFLDKQLKKFGYTQVNAQYFDTLRFELPEHVSAQQIRTIALSKEVNLRYFENGNVGFSIDETTDVAAANVLLSIFAIAAGKDYQKVDDIPEKSNIDKTVKRTTPFLTHEVFNKYHTETEMMRYIKRLDRKDISLAQSMISLGFMYHETECRCGNAAFEPSRIYRYASIGSGRPGGRVSGID